MIVDALAQLAPDIAVTLVSYATGAQTFRSMGRAVVDLELPEQPPTQRLMIALAATLGRSEPETAVVSHEEFAVLPIAKRRPERTVLFMADWLPPARTYEARCLDYADEILMLEWPGGQPSAAGALASRMRFVGPVIGVPQPTYDRMSTRTALGADSKTFVAVVAPGGSDAHSEVNTPLCDLVLSAWDLLSFQDKRLLWVAERRSASPARWQSPRDTAAHHRQPLGVLRRHHRGL